jgi:hypothetical protein
MSIPRTRPATARLLLLALVAAVVGAVAEVRTSSATSMLTAEDAELLFGDVAGPGVDADAERIRIAAHLERVESELRRRDVSHLSDAQRTARARHLEVLREYRLAGVFPLNHDFRDAREPYFIDAHGTLCAMAYLIARSGAGDLVERVAASRNNAYIAELASDPELIAWLDAAGLTAEEAGMIQPTYDWQPPQEERDPDAVTTGYAVSTVASTGLGIASVVLNAQVRHAPERFAGALGVASGTLAIGLGAARLNRSGETQRYAIWNAALGSLVTAVGVRTLIAAGSDRGAQARSGPDAGPTVEAMPMVTPSGGGVSLRIRF